MYRPDLSTRDRTGAIAAVLAIHAGLVLLLLNMSGRIELPDPQAALQVIDVFEAPKPPPPPPPPPPPQSSTARPKEREGGSSPKNIESEATPVVAPKPIVAPLIPNPVVVTETPRQGAEATQGASNVVGPGTGAGGLGTGLGSGRGGSGPGGGGGGAVIRTRLISPPLGGRDFSQDLLRQWPRGRPLFARFRIAPNGAILQCIIDRGTGVPAIDANFCALAGRRLRFRPGLDRQGRPVADWAAYGQQPPR